MDKKDYYFAYFEKLTNQLEQIENPSRYALDNREFLCKYIWINVKVFRYIETDEYKSKEKVISNLELGFLLENIILLLNPKN